jgi:hypothetical protein
MKTKLTALSLKTLRRMLRDTVALAGADSQSANILRRAIAGKEAHHRRRRGPKVERLFKTQSGEREAPC